jgi:hypothetical protein
MVTIDDTITAALADISKTDNARSSVRFSLSPSDRHILEAGIRDHAGNLALSPNATGYALQDFKYMNAITAAGAYNNDEHYKAALKKFEIDNEATVDLASYISSNGFIQDPRTLDDNTKILLNELTIIGTLQRCIELGDSDTINDILGKIGISNPVGLLRSVYNGAGNKDALIGLAKEMIKARKRALIPVIQNNKEYVMNTVEAGLEAHADKNSYVLAMSALMKYSAETQKRKDSAKKRD